MGWNDHLPQENEFNYLKKCPHCKKTFRVMAIEQIPGFRDTEYLYCPYCKHLIETSMTYEFSTCEIEED